MKRLILAILILAACRRETPIQPVTATRDEARAAQVAPILPDVERPNVQAPRRAVGLLEVPAATTKRRAVATSTPVVIPITPKMRGGIGYPIVADMSVRRMNLLLVNNARIPRETWEDPIFREAMRISGDSFPVNLWRMRAGVATFIVELRVPSGPAPAYNQVALSPQNFRAGDVAIVEYTPALMVERISGSSGVALPFLSVIDPGSQDPSPTYGAFVGFEGAKP